jgi:hypothetical protein
VDGGAGIPLQCRDAGRTGGVHPVVLAAPAQERCGHSATAQGGEDVADLVEGDEIGGQGRLHRGSGQQVSQQWPYEKLGQQGQRYKVSSICAGSGGELLEVEERALVIEHSGEQTIPGAEDGVEAGNGTACSLGDRLQGERAEAALGDELGGRGNDAFPHQQPVRGEGSFMAVTRRGCAVDEE